MSVKKAAERFDLVRLMADEGARLPPAKEPEQQNWPTWSDMVVGAWSHHGNHGNHGNLEDAYTHNVWAQAAREWARPLRNILHQQARNASFGIPYSYNQSPIQQVPRREPRPERTYQFVVDDVTTTNDTTVRWAQAIGRLNRSR